LIYLLIVDALDVVIAIAVAAAAVVVVVGHLDY
jgi:hypothetical protein